MKQLKKGRQATWEWAGRWLRCVIFSSRQFKRDQCALRASSLTFFTLLSIVPVMAMIFGIAKGFGLKSVLEKQLFKIFPGQDAVVLRIIEFSENLLDETKGSVIALLGIALLFYTVIKMFGHIEDAFNKVWRVNRNRSIGRKFSDYTALFFTAPFLIVFSGSITIFVATKLHHFLDKLYMPAVIEKIVSFSFGVIPFISVWVLFIFFYIFIPNTKVNVKSAVVGGIVAGTVYQAGQMLYFKFQVGVSHYNAIYGSFAALPLFIIWIQISWIVLLAGVEISYALENLKTADDFDTEYTTLSFRMKKLLALRTVLLCVRRFKQGKPPLSYGEISAELRIPLEVTRQLLIELTECALLSTVKREDGSDGFQPAKDIETLHLGDVIFALEKRGDEHVAAAGTLEVEALSDTLADMEKAAERSGGHRLFKDI